MFVIRPDALTAAVLLVSALCGCSTSDSEPDYCPSFNVAMDGGADAFSAVGE